MMSLSFMMRSSAPSILTSVPDHLPNRTRSPFLKSSGDDLAVFAARARAHSNDLALLRLLGGGIGNDDAAGGLGFALDAGVARRDRGGDEISWCYAPR